MGLSLTTDQWHAWQCKLSVRLRAISSCPDERCVHRLYLPGFYSASASCCLTILITLILLFLALHDMLLLQAAVMP